ncbi:MAG: hypothetical protein IIA92_06330 [Chloroflexi bacterium]|nr:hypothetical protein [Chloroflexota bacterium]
MEYVKFEKVSLKNHPELNEKWVQDRIAEDPSLLGLGDLILKDRERTQPRAGRLDLLFQHEEELRRYEVEIQLGPTDESHIIRTIEYWDIERKRYPQYEHTAVIIAEDITSRFLNVISLFNGTIPLVAIQMKALKLEQQVSLDFTTVLDQVSLGLEEDDEEIRELTDRAWWVERKGSPTTLTMADDLLELIHNLDPAIGPKYNKFYIGLAKNGVSTTFIKLRPKRDFIRFEPRLEETDEIHNLIRTAGLEELEYKQGRFRVKLYSGDIESQSSVLTQLIKEAYQNAGF